MDASGNKHHPTNNGAVLTSDRNNVVDQAYLFDGVNDFMEIASWDSLCPTDEVSISFWSRTDVYTSQFAYSLAPENSTLGRMAISINYKHGTAPATFWDYDNITSGRLQLLNDPFIDDWEHYVFTASKSADSLRMYRNGELIKSQGMGPGLTTRSRAFWIGALDNTTTSSNFNFNGALDEIRIYNREIDSCEVKVLADGNTTSPVITDIGGTLSSTIFANYKWFKDGVEIPNHDYSFYTPTVSGNYYVVTSILDGCYWKKSNEIEIVIVIEGTNSTDEASNIKVFPNPTSESVFIEMPHSLTDCEFIIQDFQGRTVHVGTLTQIRNRIDLSGYNAGIYFLKVLQSDQEIRTIKLTVY